MDKILKRILVGLLVLALVLFPTGDLEAARSFNGTSDYLNSAATVDLSATSTVSIAFWLWENSFGSGDLLAAESSTNYNSNTGAFIVDTGSVAGGCGTTFHFGVQTNGGVGAQRLRSFTQPSAGAWHEYVLVMNSKADTGWAAYMDGTAQTLTNCNNGTPLTTNNFGNFTIYLMSRAGSALFNAGRLAEFAVWNIALGQADATSLAGGALANTVQGANLVRYVQICGSSSPEPDQVSGNWTVTGTTQVAQPPSVSDCGAVASCNNFIALLGAGCK